MFQFKYEISQLFLVVQIYRGFLLSFEQVFWILIECAINIVKNNAVDLIVVLLFHQCKIQ